MYKKMVTGTYTRRKEWSLYMLPGYLLWINSNITFPFLVSPYQGVYILEVCIQEVSMP